MPGEVVSWTVPPLAKSAIKHRKEIFRAWQVIADYLKGKSIAFTGIAGIGKTVLFDFLCGDAHEAGYKPPPPSVVAERGKVKKEEVNKRLRVTVVPGDHSAPRIETLESLFSRRKRVEGVIHVVANGFVDVRNPYARESLIKDAKLKTIEQFTKYQKKAELADLDRTCELIRHSMNEARRPRWVMIAVTKVDLYQSGLEEAERSYSPHGNSPFVKRLKELQSQVGSDNLRWHAVPVCTG
jgi:hypothetical protein